MLTEKRKVLAFAGVLALLSACVPPSVHPFYTDNDLVFDPLLVGVWFEEGKTQPTDENWTVEKGDGKSYKLTVTDDEGKKGEFEGRLFKLKDYLFLDLKPSRLNLDARQSEVPGWVMIPGHWIFRVHSLGSKLALSAPDLDWLNEYSRKYPKALAHVGANSPLYPFDPYECRAQCVSFITASTQDLQQFVLAHLGENELFGKPGVFVRQTTGARN